MLTDPIAIIMCMYNGGCNELYVSQECCDKYKELFQVDLKQDIDCCRTDQNLIKVIHLLGIEVCNGPRTTLRMDWIPKEMEEYLVIQKYDGPETIYIDYNEAYTKVLHDLMKHNCHGINKLNDVMSNSWSSCDQCDCIPKDAYDKYHRISYIEEKMRCLPKRYSKEMPDINIFSYNLS
jgi:hypothetical protein